MTEFYKKIPNFEEYQVSNFGRVRRFKRKDMMFKPIVVTNRKIAISQNGNKKSFYLPTLINELFKRNNIISEFRIHIKQPKVIKPIIERWVDLKGLEGTHQISDKGVIRRFWLHRGFVILKTRKNHLSQSVSVSLPNEWGNSKNRRIGDLLKENFTRVGFVSGSVNPVYLFSLKGEFIGRFSSHFQAKKKFKLCNLDSSKLMDMREGNVVYNSGYLVIQENHYTKEKIKKYLYDKETKVCERDRKKLKVKILKTIIITDKNFIPIESFNGTLTELSKREGIPLGTMKAKIHKDKKQLKKFFNGNSHQTTSIKRYFNYLEFAEITNEFNKKETQS